MFSFVILLSVKYIFAFRLCFYKCHQLTFVSRLINVRVLNITRSQLTKQTGLNAGALFDELLSVCGLDYFNIQWNWQRNADASKLADVLRNARIRHHFQERIHRLDRILALVIYRQLTRCCFFLVVDTPDDVNHVVDLYNSTLRDFVVKHTSLKTKEMPKETIPSMG